MMNHTCLVLYKIIEKKNLKTQEGISYFNDIEIEACQKLFNSDCYYFLKESFTKDCIHLITQQIPNRRDDLEHAEQQLISSMSQINQLSTEYYKHLEEINKTMLCFVISLPLLFFKANWAIFMVAFQGSKTFVEIIDFVHFINSIDFKGLAKQIDNKLLHYSNIINEIETQITLTKNFCEENMFQKIQEIETVCAGYISNDLEAIGYNEEL